MAKQTFDFRSFQKYLTPHAGDDLNHFLEKLPQNAGKGALIAAGISWGMVAMLGLFSMMQMQSLTDLRAKLLESEALKPVVPVISYQPIDPSGAKALAEEFKNIYAGMQFTANGGAFTIQSKSTADYAQFREALGHVVNGGQGWSVTVDSLCVGRECKGNALEAKLKIEKVNIDKPSL